MTAVESGAGAVRDLQFNAERAGLENLHAMPQTAEEHLARLEKAPDFVVLDPPRTGLGKAVVGAVGGVAPAGRSRSWHATRRPWLATWRGWWRRVIASSG